MLFRFIILRYFRLYGLTGRRRDRYPWPLNNLSPLAANRLAGSLMNAPGSDGLVSGRNNWEGKTCRQRQSGLLSPVYWFPLGYLFIRQMSKHSKQPIRANMHTLRNQFTHELFWVLTILLCPINSSLDLRHTVFQTN